MVVDADMAELPTLEASFMVTRVVLSEGFIIVAACPPDFSVSDDSFFFFGQER